MAHHRRLRGRNRGDGRQGGSGGLRQGAARHGAGGAHGPDRRLARRIPRRLAADRGRAGRQVQPVRLAHHGVLGDAHATPDLGRRMSLCPQGTKAIDRFRGPVHAKLSRPPHLPYTVVHPVAGIQVLVRAQSAKSCGWNAGGPPGRRRPGAGFQNSRPFRSIPCTPFSPFTVCVTRKSTASEQSW